LSVCIRGFKISRFSKDDFELLKGFLGGARATFPTTGRCRGRCDHPDQGSTKMAGFGTLGLTETSIL
uniref:Uncharacterized protein n=1 Tax=Romanomermis culicivorax TaxID=13658 RepID=A0A915HIB4_ROMCU